MEARNAKVGRKGDRASCRAGLDKIRALVSRRRVEITGSGIDGYLRVNISRLPLIVMYRYNVFV